MRRRLPFLAALLVLLAACESYDCTLYNYVGLYGDFLRDGAYVSLSDTLTITSGKSGPVLLNRSVQTSDIKLPMTHWQKEDTLVLSIKGDNYFLQDTIWIAKTNQVHYESPDCPTTLFHTIEEVRSTHVFIKSINVIRSSVNYETSTNLEINLLSAD